MRWSERPPVVRSRFPSLQPFRVDPRSLPVAVAHLVLVRRHPHRHHATNDNTTFPAFTVLAR